MPELLLIGPSLMDAGTENGCPNMVSLEETVVSVHQSACIKRQKYGNYLSFHFNVSKKYFLLHFVTGITDHNRVITPSKAVRGHFEITAFTNHVKSQKAHKYTDTNKEPKGE